MNRFYDVGNGERIDKIARHGVWRRVSWRIQGGKLRHDVRPKALSKLGSNPLLAIT
jgi:hypothetical protein